MTDVRYIRPNKKMIQIIASNMRQSDIDEVWASNRHTPLQALMNSWEMSDLSTIILCNGIPVTMLGLVKRDLLTGSGTIWMLGTTQSLRYKKEFLRQAKLVINEMLSVCPRLSNRVHSKNKKSIQWLRYLGFHIDEPHQFGSDNELFHRFHLERSN